MRTRAELMKQIAALLRRDLSPWTFDGSEPMCLELYALITEPTTLLRDWFAGQALSSIIRTPLALGERQSWEEIARNSYIAADAMLKERVK